MSESDWIPFTWSMKNTAFETYREKPCIQSSGREQSHCRQPERCPGWGPETHSFWKQNSRVVSLERWDKRLMSLKYHRHRVLGRRDDGPVEEPGRRKLSCIRCQGDTAEWKKSCRGLWEKSLEFLMAPGLSDYHQLIKFALQEVWHLRIGFKVQVASF